MNIHIKLMNTLVNWLVASVDAIRVS